MLAEDHSHGGKSFYKVRVVTSDPGDATTFMPPGSDPITS